VASDIEPAGPLPHFNFDQGMSALFAFSRFTAEEIDELRMKTSMHEGQLAGLDRLIASVQATIASGQATIQSYIHSAMRTGAILGIILAGLVALQVYGLARTDSESAVANDRFMRLTDETRDQFTRVAEQFSKVNGQFAGVDERMGALESQIRELPAAVSQQMLAVAASMATVRGNQSPPPERAPKPQR